MSGDEFGNELGDDTVADFKGDDLMDDTTVSTPMPMPVEAPPPATSLPQGEPDGGSVDEQRTEILANLEELEGTFRYMGTGHARYAATKARIDELNGMLKRLDLMTGGG